jgi:phosphoglycolate phosphatase
MAILSGATIVFDLDGTLVDTAPDLIGALNHVLIDSGLEPVSMDEVGGLIGHGARAMIERGMALQGGDLGDEDMATAMALFLDYYRAHIADASRLFDGADTSLDLLRDAGATLAICTNKPQALSEQLLQSLGLLQKFSAILGADAVPRKKPDGDHIVRTVQAAGGEMSRAVMIGDSRTDERAARNARLPFIWVPFGYEVETREALRPDAVLNHYSELFSLLNRLLD